MQRKPVFWVAGVLTIAGLVWLRGSGLAWVLGGRYPFASFAFDFFGFCFLLLVLGLISQAIRRSCQRLLKERRWAQHITYPFAMLITAFPWLLVAIHLHPQRVAGLGSYTPAQLGLTYQAVSFQSDGLTLAGWFIPADKPQQPIILVTHGLHANKASFLYVAKPLHEAGLNVFTFDFRAHGESAGHTVTFGLNEARDVKAAYDWLTKTYPSQPIYALGFSMGGAAVARAAGEYGIFERIALDSTFARFDSVVRATMLKRFGPLRPLLWHMGRGWAWLWTQRDFADNQPAQSLARQSARRLLLIHGTADTTIPVSEALQLKEATAAFSELWLIEGSKHVQSYRQPDYQRRLAQFFSSQEQPTGHIASGLPAEGRIP